MTNQPTNPLERAYPFVELDAAELAQIVAPVMTVDPSVVEITALPGHSNSSYRVRQGDQSLMVRLITSNLDAYLKEFNLLSRFGATLPSPKPLHFILSSPASHSYPVAIHDWLEGDSLAAVLAERPEETGAAARAVGKALVRFHEVPFAKSVFLTPQIQPAQAFKMNKQGYTEYMTGLLTQSLAGHRLQRLREPIRRFVRDFAAAMDQIPANCNLVHGDFRPDNIILRSSEDGLAVSGLLNWEHAMSWTTLFDLSQLLSSPLSTRAEFEPEVVRAYAEHGGEIPNEWDAIQRLLQLLSLCDVLSRPGAGSSLQRMAMERVAAIIG